ncbi:hypothetical protein BY996DRAFT_6412110 [Phakopsora pachyrhizi]|nr:hypothetical protein BY996DRAFT_6412110 [Phakopsora pachyrhizi]
MCLNGTEKQEWSKGTFLFAGTVLAALLQFLTRCKGALLKTYYWLIFLKKTSNVQLILAIDFNSKRKYIIPEISSFDLGIKDFKARIIAVSPMIGVARESLPYYPTQCLIRALAKCFPTIKVSELPIPRRRHSIDPSIKKRFKSDPQKFHGTLRLSTAPALLDGVEFIRKEGSNLNIPFIIFHGNKDEVTDCSSSKKFYEEAKATNKEFKIYNNINVWIISKGY